MLIALAVLSLGALAAPMWILAVRNWPGPGPSGPPPPLEDGYARDLLATLEARLDDLEERPDVNIAGIHDLLETLASRMDTYETELAQAHTFCDRREKRIRSAVSSALRRFEEDGEISPGFEAVVGELRPGDGNGGRQIEMPFVQEHVEEDEPSSIPGVTLAELRRAQSRSD